MKASCLERAKRAAQEVVENVFAVSVAFLETLIPSHRIKGTGSYSFLTIELLHNLHHKIAKVVMKCTLSYLSSNNRWADEGRNRTKGFVRIQRTVLWGRNTVRIVLESNGKFQRTCTDSSKGRQPSNGTNYLQRLRHMNCWNIQNIANHIKSFTSKRRSLSNEEKWRKYLRCGRLCYIARKSLVTKKTWCC